jgi:DUF971 family protein
MAQQATAPIEIRRIGVHAVRIAWADGHASEYANAYLRERCPCAECRERGRKTLPVRGQEADLYPVQIGVVGRYALSIQWSDGHDAGIYSYATLRALCPCDHCRPTDGAAAQ